jgi:hypothetical protein
MIASSVKKERVALAKSIVAIEKQHGSMPKATGNPAAPAFIEPRQTSRRAGDSQTAHGRPVHMSRPATARIVSVLAGAAALLGLEQGLGMTLYVAVPAAIVVYFAVRFAFSLLWGAGGNAG